MTHYHNIIWITGPADLVECLHIVFEQDLQGFMLKPDAVRRADYMKFGRHWEIAHWGFVGEPRVMDVSLILPDNAKHTADAVGTVKAHIVTKDGNLEMFVNILASKNPRMHISFGSACAMDWSDGFAGSVIEYAHGKRQTSSYELSGPSEDGTETHANGSDTIWAALRQAAVTELPLEGGHESLPGVREFLAKISRVYGASKEHLLEKGKSVIEIRTKLVDSAFWRRILGKGRKSGE